MRCDLIPHLLKFLVHAQVKLLPGRYHWRVASVGPQGAVGPFGTVRSFELAQPAP